MPDFFQAYTLEQVIQNGIAVLLVFAGIVSTLFVIWWGFLMIVSGWAEEKVKVAVNHIRHALFGIVFIVAVLYVVPTFLNLIGSGYSDMVQPHKIYGSVVGLTEKIFGQTVEITPPPSTMPSGLPDDFSDF